MTHKIPMVLAPQLYTQRGTALVMSLVILMVLTILGIAAMGTSSLEEKMAGATQEGTRAFEAAESGVNSTLSKAGSLDTTNTCFSTPPNWNNITPTFTYGFGKSGSANVRTCFIQFSPPKRGSGFSAKFGSSQAANFTVESTGTTTAQARTVIEQGIAQIMPPQ